MFRQLLLQCSDAPKVFRSQRSLFPANGMIICFSREQKNSLIEAFFRQVVRKSIIMNEPDVPAIQREICYLIRQLCVFYKLRTESKVVMEAYTDRLQEAASTQSKQDKKAALPMKKLLRWPEIVAHLKRAASVIVRVLHFLDSIPQFVSQKRKIDRLRTSQEIFHNLILATASNRLNGLQASVGPRKYFTLLVSDFSCDENRSAIDREIAAARYLFACEPLFTSPLWRIKDKCWDDGVFIVDASFLLFLGLIAVFTGKARYVGHGLSSWKHYYVLRGESIPRLQALYNILVATILVEGYRLTFAGPHSINAYFLTSNSFVTEILRFYLIPRRRCSSICEIMHGIPTIFYERYVADMIKEGSGYAAAQKHSSIAQLPMLPMFGVLLTDVKCHPGTSVNTYLNKYWIDRQRSNADFAAIIESEFQAGFSKRGISEKTLIITFIGGGTQYHDFFRSETFEIECFIMRYVKKIMDQTAQPYITIYTPHPSYPLTKFQTCEFFLEEGIVVYPDTIFTWFLSDMCLSLISSALFEASYFEAHAFTPTIRSDDMYPDVLLDLLDHPKDDADRSFVEDLTRFLLSHARRTPVDLMSRAKKRACRFRQTNKHGWLPEREIAG